MGEVEVENDWEKIGVHTGEARQCLEKNLAVLLIMTLTIGHTTNSHTLTLQVMRDSIFHSFGF